jgi:acyl carrier protein
MTARLMSGRKDIRSAYPRLVLREAHTPSGVTQAAMTPSDSNRADSNQAQETELATLIVKTLNLEVAPAEIDPEAPLYGEGLGLDSIDILEIALAVSQTYGVKLRSDDKNNNEIFRSVRLLNAYIQQHRET